MSSNPAIASVGLTHKMMNNPTATIELVDRVNPFRLLSPASSDASKADLATATSEVIGVSLRPGDANDTDYPDVISYKLITSPGHFTVYTAETSLSVGDYVWQAANGTVSATYSDGMLFEVVEAISAAGLVQVRPIPKYRQTTVTIDASQASANAANGVDTGWGTDVYCVAATCNGSPAEAALTCVDGTTDGTVNITATSFSENDVVIVITTPAASSSS